MTPLCECHGLPKALDRSCRVKRREYQNAALLTDKGRARARRFRLKEQLKRRRVRLSHREEQLQ